MPSRDSRGIVRFGPFEVDLDEGVLRKHGIRISLQAQPFEVLAALLENPGATVTRDELRQRLWKNDTFVDFEHGLNVAVTRLRRALGDSAERSRHIETLAKRGYRFCGDVERAPATTAESARGPVIQPPHARPTRVRLLWVVAALAICGPAWHSLGPSGRPAQQAVVARRAVPLTAFRGSEADPALSPDGAHVAFTWDGPRRDNTDIYIMPVDSDRPVRLTFDPAEDISPAWSPDGRTIAFVRRLREDLGVLLLIPAAGGPEHVVHEIRNRELRLPRGRATSLAWTPDGAWLAASHRGASDPAESIYLFSRTGSARRITDGAACYGDQMPAFSPDGRALAFTALDGFSNSEIHSLRLTANYERDGQTRALTAHKRWSANPVWLPDSKRILYITAEEPDARHELRMTSVFDREPSGAQIPLEGGPAEFTFGRHLIYTQIRRDSNIWRARVARPGEPPTEGEPFISSTKHDEKPRFSPGGRKVVFTSSRSGSPELYVANADGADEARLTDFGGPLMGQGNWSPDGQWLAFHARPEGQADVFVIPSAGGAPRRLTTDPADDTMPSYSWDGRWLYFTSSRTGRVEIWKMPAGGGPAIQLTTSGGQRPFETPDRRAVVYLTPMGTAIHSVPAGGGPPTLVAAPVHSYPSGFAVTSSGLYYAAPPHSGQHSFIMFLSWSSRERRPVAVARYPFYLGMTVSPDDRQILFDQTDQFDSDLMLMKDFFPGQ